MPDSDRFTLSTSSACRSILRFLCTTPIPPCWARAIASAASVTVSIAAEQSGICKRMFRVNCVAVSVSYGKTSERSGISKTSSKVKPSSISEVIIGYWNSSRNLGVTSALSASLRSIRSQQCDNRRDAESAEVAQSKQEHSDLKQNGPPFERAVGVIGGAHFRASRRKTRKHS